MLRKEKLHRKCWRGTTLKAHSGETKMFAMNFASSLLKMHVKHVLLGYICRDDGKGCGVSNGTGFVKYVRAALGQG